MQHPVLYYQSGTYLKSLEIIDGIKFTSREIDILACVLSGKSVGVIASLLNISARTLEVHFSNIRVKLNCNSRNGIIEFLEKSSKLPALKEHYQYLLTEGTFNKSLKKISKLIGKKLSIKIFYNKNDEALLHFIEKIKSCLNRTGIEATLYPELDNKSILLPSNIHLSSTDCILHILNKKCIDQLALQEHIKKLEESHALLPNIHIIPIFFLLNEELPTSKLLENLGCIDCSYSRNFYSSFFLILKKLFPHLDLNNLIDEFNVFYETIQTHNHEKPIQAFTQLPPQNPIFKSKKNIALAISILTLLIVSI